MNWNRKLKSVDAVDDTYKLTFSDGIVEAGYDMVVGADGKVRPLVGDIKQYYSSVTLIKHSQSNVTRSSPWLSNYVRSMFDENRAIMTQRNGNDGVKVYVDLTNCGLRR